MGDQTVSTPTAASNQLVLLPERGFPQWNLSLPGMVFAFPWQPGRQRRVGMRPDGDSLAHSCWDLGAADDPCNDGATPLIVHQDVTDAERPADDRFDLHLDCHPLGQVVFRAARESSAAVRASRPLLVQSDVAAV